MRETVCVWAGRWLLRFARLLFFHAKTIRVCWICGRHPGMGTFWGGAEPGSGRITCDQCYENWGRLRPEFIVDWRGLGRLKSGASIEKQVQP